VRPHVLVKSFSRTKLEQNRNETLGTLSGQDLQLRSPFHTVEAPLLVKRTSNPFERGNQLLITFHSRSGCTNSTS